MRWNKEETMQIGINELYPYRKYFPQKINDENIPLHTLTSKLTKEMIRSDTLEKKVMLSNLIISLKTQPNEIRKVIADIDRSEKSAELIEG